ncbi:hypothetical protein J4225_04970 [Candidatus Pacearchaeota archaeon]|nr:hypothetical protein [Candidatus Pacearchaeota archaeon]
MKRDVKVTAIAIVIAIILIAGVNFITQPTGKATFTKGASYGPIPKETINKVECVYLSEDDGWDVTKQGRVRYFNKAIGDFEEPVDVCVNFRTVREYNCEKGYGQTRDVICPSNTICSNGACIAE